MAELFNPTSLQPTSNGLRPTSDGLQPTRDGLKPNSKVQLPEHKGVFKDVDGNHHYSAVALEATQ